MNIEFAELELVGQSFVFAENVNLIRGNKISVRVDDLNVADLEIIHYHIVKGNIKTNVPAEVFKSKALALRGQFEDEDIDEATRERLLAIQDTTVKPEVKEILSEEQIKANKHAEFVKEFTEKIINVSAPTAMLALKTYAFEDQDQIKSALELETSHGNRRGVVAKLKSLINE